ncbi:MAG: CarD family transcriptional regulator, partial [Candidatus Pacebacteria bacterium]|nr:CarD family transcriptional regulator [Candidatus Paceibacterota bacterium]
MKNDLFFFSVGEYFLQTKFLKLLHDFGYVKVDVCKYPGEYSHKGMMISVFPVSYDQIFQIEYEGNVISRVNIVKGEKGKAKKVDVKFRKDDYVVHLDHGIGIYRGEEDGFFVIEYGAPKNSLKPDLLYVPLDKKNKIDKYYGFSTPSLHRLSTQVWNETKKKVKEDIILFAKELLKLYAKKEVSSTIPLYGDSLLEDELDSSFLYDLTSDQEKAVNDILQDLEKTKPMDRLVLGDVGFGKTEVAIRASFRVVLNKKQVVVLCPTTILANQHLGVFQERLGDLGVRVEILSRLNGSVKNQEILEKVKKGEVDVLIGTHRLLSLDVKFCDLGLLIIDEEQRFGVKQKEKIRSLKTGVHLLSMSATPIPRT